MTKAALSTLALLSAVVAARPAHAAATFELVVTDEPGVGFNDMTPATPIGGNMGTTVGEQRRIAFQHALDIWGKALDSPIPIIVSASFGPLECTATNATLGQAGPASMQYELPGQQPDILFPEALADRIAGVDITPGMPDIEAEFNGSLPQCFAGLDWYYGLDAKAPDALADLIMTVLHEVGHGLGFLSTVVEETGELLNPGLVDPFTTKVTDAASGMPWDMMTDAARLTALGTARGLVWNGQYGNSAAATWLTAGAPRIRTMPDVPGLRDALIDANYGRLLSAGPVMGMVALPTPPDQCDDVAPMTGLIAVLPQSNCHPLNQLDFAQFAGAVGGILVSDEEPPPAIDQSPEDLAIIAPTLPVVGMMKADTDKLLAATGVTVELYADMTRRTGTDAMGRVYIFASQPITNSSGSHIDPAVRPDAVLEPSQTVNIHHDVTLERAMLRDIGWATTCGNGMLDAGEQCDNGTVADACRTSCLLAKCGDSVVDTGEQCDSAMSGMPCNPNCTLPVCGDGVVTTGEECDNGASNSNTAPDACRTTCKRAKCGDGVVDSTEACDPATATPTCVACMVVAGVGGSAGAGGSVTTGGTAGSGPNTGGTAGTGPNTGGAGPAGAGGTGGEDDPGTKASGCGCQVPGAGERAGSAWALVAGLVGLSTLRRRRLLGA
jgi:MYXO-CTERM domain-containing protein